MSHYENNDPESKVVHAGHINTCIECDEVYGVLDEHEIVEVSAEDLAANPDADDEGSDGDSPAIIASPLEPLAALPKWMPPAALRRGRTATPGECMSQSR